MPKSKRDPSIGLEWLAWWALQGDEDPEFIRMCLEDAENKVGTLSASATWAAVEGKELFHEEAVAILSYVHFLLVQFAEAASPKGTTWLELQFHPRKSSQRGGRRRLSFEEVKRRRKAAAIAERHIANKATRPEAFEAALIEMRLIGQAQGLSEGIIEDWVDKGRRQLRRLRERDPRPTE